MVSEGQVNTLSLIRVRKEGHFLTGTFIGTTDSEYSPECWDCLIPGDITFILHVLTQRQFFDSRLLLHHKLAEVVLKLLDLPSQIIPAIQVNVNTETVSGVVSRCIQLDL